MTQINSNQVDDSIVKSSGNQTITGVKTFTDIPVLPASNPTTDNQATRKKYVDDVSSKITDDRIFLFNYDNVVRTFTTSEQYVDVKISTPYKVKKLIGGFYAIAGSFVNLSAQESEIAIRTTTDREFFPYALWSETGGHLGIEKDDSPIRLRRSTTHLIINDPDATPRYTTTLRVVLVEDDGITFRFTWERTGGTNDQDSSFGGKFMAFY